MTLKKRQHQYRHGMQHRAKQEVWDAAVDSFVFFMQNTAARTCWPVTDAAIARFKQICAEPASRASASSLLQNEQTSVE